MGSKPQPRSASVRPSVGRFHFGGGAHCGFIPLSVGWKLDAEASGRRVSSTAPDQQRSLLCLFCCAWHSPAKFCNFDMSWPSDMKVESGLPDATSRTSAARLGCNDDAAHVSNGNTSETWRSHCTRPSTASAWMKSTCAACPSPPPLLPEAWAPPRLRGLCLGRVWRRGKQEVSCITM